MHKKVLHGLKYHVFQGLNPTQLYSQMLKKKASGHEQAAVQRMFYSCVVVVEVCLISVLTRNLKSMGKAF